MPYIDKLSNDDFQLLMRVKEVIENYEINVLKNKFQTRDERNEDNWLVVIASWPENPDKRDMQVPIMYFENRMNNKEILEMYLTLFNPEQTLLI
jgi:UTP:GlnB (protein PII) uridylyltransferase